MFNLVYEFTINIVIQNSLLFSYHSQYDAVFNGIITAAAAERRHSNDMDDAETGLCE